MLARKASHACVRYGSGKVSKNESSPCSEHNTGTPRVCRIAGPKPLSKPLDREIKSGFPSAPIQSTSRCQSSACRPCGPRKVSTVISPNSRALVMLARSAAARSTPGASRKRNKNRGSHRSNHTFCRKYKLIPPTCTAAPPLAGASSVTNGKYSGTIVTSCPSRRSAFTKWLSRKHDPQ